MSKVDNKMPNLSGLVSTTVLNTKISWVENKIPNHDKYITTPEYDKLAAENFTARIKQTNLLTKTDFDKNLTSFNRKITSNKTKYLEAYKKLNSPTRNDYNLNTFVYLPTRDMLELKKDIGTGYGLSWKSNRVYNSSIYNWSI